MTVLLIDDDRELVEMLTFAFRRAGLATSVAHDVASGLVRFEQDRPDLVVLDLHLGGSNGFDFLEQVRKRSQIPIIILTALASEDDKVRGLSLGADDYVTKPFGHRELLTRIMMRLRRAGQRAPRPMPDVLNVADIELDASAHTVQRAGRAVNLTVTEFRLLHHLLVNAGQVVRTEDILRHVWGDPDPTDSDVLRVTLHRLRRKLGETGASQGILRTVPGIGVLLQGERQASPPEPVSDAEEGLPPIQTVATVAELGAPAAAAPRTSAREPAAAAVDERPGRIEREGQDQLRLRFRPEAEIESILFGAPAAKLERYDSATDEVTWSMPARGQLAWDVFEVARRHGFTFADDVDIPAPPPRPVNEAPIVSAVPAAPTPLEPAVGSGAPAVHAPPPALVAAVARAGAGRAASGIERAATVALSMGARGRAALPRSAKRKAAPTSASPSAPEAVKKTTAREPLRARMAELGERMSGSGRFAAMFLGVTMIAALLSILAEIARLGLLSELERNGEISVAAYNQSQARQLIFALTLLVLYVLSAAGFLIWVNRSYARLRSRGLAGLRYTPVTAVVWFFVPIAFFFVPRRVISELWHASALREGGRIERRARVPLLIALWWTLFVAFAISAALTGATTANPTIGDLFRETWMNVGSDALALVAAGLGVLVISAIELRRPVVDGVQSRPPTKSDAPRRR